MLALLAQPSETAAADRILRRQFYGDAQAGPGVLAFLSPTQNA